MTAILRLLLLLPVLACLASPCRAQLELPDRARPRPGATPRQPTRPAPAGERPSTVERPDEEPSPERRVKRLVSDLLDQRDFGDPRSEAWAGELLELPGGRTALLQVLADDRPVALVAAARTLLAQERPESFPIVASRLQERLPARAIQPLLDAVRRSDPVRGGPPLLAGLLDHPQSNMRHAARSALEGQIGPETLPHLVAVLSSRRSETRLAALSIAAQIDDPAVLHLLLERLGDPSSKVAAEASRLLAASTDARAPQALRELALGRQAIGAQEQRRAAYALLAIAEREELGREVLLSEDDVEPLLAALRSSHPALKGVAAIALAGLGFRSERPDETPWLDLEVPHELVKIASGAEFHSDFSSLQGPATRRLTRIGGVAFGSDGPAWQAWWARNAGDFRARRAVVLAGPEDAAGLRLTVSRPESADPPRSFGLLGPRVVEERAGSGQEPRPVFYLTEEECRDLLGVLRRQGLLSAERLPGSRGIGRGDEWTLALEIAGQAKEFRLGGSSAGEEWFTTALDFAHALAERNGWQRYVDQGEHSSQRQLWLAEREWWAAERPAGERARRQVQRITRCWSQLSEEQRESATVDLERLCERSSDPSDFGPLVACLAADRNLARGRRLVTLALAAADDRMTAVQGRELLRVVWDSFGKSGRELTRRVLAETPPEVALAASADDRTHLREVVADVLLELGDERGRERFRALLEDPAPSVRAAAARAAGRSGDEAWHAVLLERATDPAPEVRASALRAVGHFGGERARELLVDGLSSSEPAVRVAAAEGLADLEDPASVPLLISLLAEGPESPLYAPGRRGLLQLRGAAWPDLMRTVHAGRGRVRRDAAFLLSQQGVAEVASTMLGWLTEVPQDAGLAYELAVLTCIDMREASDPPSAWWEWWDLVVHDDATAWLKAALERERIDAPPLEEFRRPRSERAAASLLAALEGPEPVLAERARRELADLVGTEVAAPPRSGTPLSKWVAEMRAAVAEVFARRQEEAR